MSLWKRELEFSINKRKISQWVKILKNPDGTLKWVISEEWSEIPLEEFINKNKLNSSSLEEQNADYRFNMARLREEEQTLAWKLADAIKWWEVDLKKFIIPLNTREPDYIIPYDTTPSEKFIFDTKPTKQILPIIETLPPDKQILPIITDTKPVNELPPEE